MKNREMKQRVYVRVDMEKYMTTGEIVPVSELLTEDMIIKTIGRAPKGDFEIVRVPKECEAWKCVAGERGKVIAFLIENRNINNELRMTTREISEKTGVSARTIGRILDDLEEVELAVQGVRSVIINPNWIHKGDNFREAAMYAEFDRTMQYYSKGKYKKTSADSDSDM